VELHPISQWRKLLEIFKREKESMVKDNLIRINITLLRGSPNELGLTLQYLT
jgi:hypothetical protein